MIAEFYDTFMSHDKLAALDVLRAGARCWSWSATQDVMTPLDHSRALADALPDARLVVVEDTGHMVALEQPDLVTDELRALLRRARDAGRA